MKPLPRLSRVRGRGRASTTKSTPAAAAGSRKVTDTPAPTPTIPTTPSAETVTASSSSCAQRLEATFKKLFICSICKKEWNQPTGLPCGHVFCSDCLQNNQPSTSTATATRRSSSAGGSFASSCEVCQLKLGRRPALVRRTDLENLSVLLHRLLEPKSTAQAQENAERRSITEPEAPAALDPPPPLAPAEISQPSQVMNIVLSHSQKELLLSDHSEKEIIDDVVPNREEHQNEPIHVSFDQLENENMAKPPDQNDVDVKMDMEVEEEVEERTEIKVPFARSVTPETEAERIKSKSRSPEPVKCLPSQALEPREPEKQRNCVCMMQKAGTKEVSIQTDQNATLAPAPKSSRSNQKPEDLQPMDLSTPKSVGPIRGGGPPKTSGITFVGPMDLSMKIFGPRNFEPRRKIFNPVAVSSNFSFTCMAISKAPIPIEIQENGVDPGAVISDSDSGVHNSGLGNQMIEAQKQQMQKCNEPPAKDVEDPNGSLTSDAFLGQLEYQSKTPPPPSNLKKRPLLLEEDVKMKQNGCCEDRDSDVQLVEEFRDGDRDLIIKKLKTDPNPTSQGSSVTFIDSELARGDGGGSNNCIMASTPKSGSTPHALKRHKTEELFDIAPPGKVGSDGRDQDTSLDSMDKHMMNLNTMAFLRGGKHDKQTPSPPTKVPDVVLEDWPANDESGSEADFLVATPDQKKSQGAPETPSQILKKMNQDYEDAKKKRLSSVFPNPADFQMEELASPSITKKNESTRLEMVKKAPQTNGASPPLVFCPTRLNSAQEFQLRTLCGIAGAAFQRNFTDQVTHLIVDLVEGRVPHTMKYFSAIGGKKWILTYDWVTECVKNGRLVPEEAFETACFKNCDRGPRISRLSSTMLFRNVTFFVGDKFSHSGISGAECKELLVKFGGKVVEDPMQTTENILLIADPRDRSFDYNWWYETKGWLTVTWEWVTDCILSFSVLPFTETGLLNRDLNISRIRLPVGISDDVYTQIDY